MAGQNARALLRRLSGSYYAAIGAIILIAATTVALSVAQRRSNAWVLHTREVAHLARGLQATAATRNGTIQSYLLTADPRFLRADSAAQVALAERVAELRAVVVVPEQAERLRRLASLFEQFDAAMAAIVAARPTEDLPAASRRVAGLSESITRPLREEFRAFLDAEEALYQAGVERSRLLHNVATGSLLAGLLLVTIVLVRFRRRCVHQAVELTAQNEQLRLQAAALEDQAIELEQQTEEAQDLAQEVEISNEELQQALNETRVAREAELRAIDERAEAFSQLEAALRSAPIGFAFYDRELRYVRVNPVLAALSGHTPEEYVGKSMRDVLPQIAPTAVPIQQRVLATGEPVLDVEVVGPTVLSGKPRHFLASYYPIRQNGGPPIGVVAVVLETTAQRELEAQLRQAQKMEAVGQLAGGIAHDFNNVLTAIRSFSELLLADLPADSGHRADVSEILSAADRAATLTRQLLAFSRRQLLQPVNLDLNHVVKGLEEMVRRLLGEDVDLECRLTPDLGVALADPGQIEQIVVNLAVNARDAMPDGGRLTFETTNAQVDEGYAARAGEMRSGDYVVLAVSDTGSGMDAATQARIFEPFFTTKEPGKGTGLGLSTVYGIVKQSGGHITVYSEPGRGTTFRVYLPRAEAASLLATPERPTSEAAPRGDETILLVEDDPAVRLVATRILSRQGYRVLQAPTPAAAETIVATHPGSVDLVITDLVLPGMSGRELGELLTVVEPRLRVLYMSGYTDDAVIRRGLLEPGMPFLSKPFTVQELVRKVRETLDMNTGLGIGRGSRGRPIPV